MSTASHQEAFCRPADRRLSRGAGGVENDLYREGRPRQRPKLIGADVLEE